MPTCTLATTVFLFITFIAIFSTLQAVKPEQDNAVVPFHVPQRDPVVMRIHDNTHYGLDELGAEDFARLFPSGGHIVHLPSTSNPHSPPELYTVTLFHQLRCLEIYHHEFRISVLRGDSEPLQLSTLADHCLNYLRETILCRPNLRVDSVESDSGKTSVDHDVVCRDWSAVYDATESNFVRYGLL